MHPESYNDMWMILGIPAGVLALALVAVLC